MDSVESRRLLLSERESNARTYARGIDRVISTVLQLVYGA